MPGETAGTSHPTLLSAKSLAVRYANGAFGITDVSIEIGSGQIVAMFGSNGAGKTTTARAISGFLKGEGAAVVRGEMRLRDKVTTNFEPQRMTKLGVACVPERGKIFPNLSVAEHMTAVAPKASKARKAELLDQALTLFPQVKEKWKTAAGRLSGGQQQMVAIARALMCDPALLVVDEMTLGLHHTLQEPLFEAMRAIAAQGTGVLLVEESTGLTLEMADYCYLLSSGVVWDKGPPERFRGNELLAAGYVGGE